MSIRVAAVPAKALAEVEGFYRRELRREVPLGSDEQVFVAREGQVVVGALRLYPEAETLVLRTVVVADGSRGRGIGRAMLVLASEAIGQRECWCFPWAYLENFYGAAGFRRIPREEVPTLLLHRLDDDCIATRREAAG